MMLARRQLAVGKRPTCQWLWRSQAEHQIAFGAFTQKQYEQLSLEEYEIAMMAAYTAPAATVEEFKAHINTGRPLPGGTCLLFKGQRDAPQAKARATRCSAGQGTFDFKGSKEKKPWQADKRTISDETGNRNKVPPYIYIYTYIYI